MSEPTTNKSSLWSLNTPQLDRISTPADLTAFTYDELTVLAEEIRLLLTRVCGRNGGHFASNLGLVELTLALHRTYDFVNKDYLVFDVGHQCYTHKILTGRRDQFITLRQYQGMSGFPTPRESSADPFLTGHASTAISSALGLAVANRLSQGERHVVAMVGDGAIGGGLCFEAMNNAGDLGEDLLIVLNDNMMSIGPTVGAFAEHLTSIRSRPQVLRARDELQQLLNRLPLIGRGLDWTIEQILHIVKRTVTESQVFSALKLRYYGPIDGHDLPMLEAQLAKLKTVPGPKVLHVLTRKGNGFPEAQSNPEAWHAAAPFSIDATGVCQSSRGRKKKQTYTDIFTKELLQQACKRSNLIAVTAAMPGGTGIKELQDKFPNRVLDVGIAEAHGITLAAGLARGGMRPVVAIYSTFLQRGYDQIVHDIALQPGPANKGLPVLFALDRAGLVGEDGPTHHGVFDLAYLGHIPNMVLMAPRDGDDLCRMLDFALDLEQPCAIRYPRGTPPDPIFSDNKHQTQQHQTQRQDLALGRGEWLKTGQDGVFLAYGATVEAACQAANLLQKDNINFAVADLRFAKPLDRQLIFDAATKYPILITVEDHVLTGGIGAGIVTLLTNAGYKNTIRQVGIPDQFIPHGSVKELKALLKLDASGLYTTAIQTIHTMQQALVQETPV